MYFANKYIENLNLILVSNSEVICNRVTQNSRNPHSDIQGEGAYRVRKFQQLNFSDSF